MRSLHHVSDSSHLVGERFFFRDTNARHPGHERSPSQNVRVSTQDAVKSFFIVCGGAGCPFGQGSISPHFLWQLAEVKIVWPKKNNSLLCFATQSNVLQCKWIPINIINWLSRYHVMHDLCLWNTAAKQWTKHPCMNFKAQGPQLSIQHKSSWSAMDDFSASVRNFWPAKSLCFLRACFLRSCSFLNSSTLSYQKTETETARKFHKRTLDGQMNACAQI